MNFNGQFMSLIYDISGVRSREFNLQNQLIVVGWVELLDIYLPIFKISKCETQQIKMYQYKNHSTLSC